MHQDLEALFEEVYRSPDALAPRLVLADALTERGDPRGEFISLQCARAGGNSSKAQREQELKLQKEHGADWLGPLAPVLDGVVFERGFLSSAVTCFQGLSQLDSLVNEPSWATLEMLNNCDVPFLERCRLPGLRKLPPLGYSELVQLSRRPRPLAQVESLFIVTSGPPTDAEVAAFTSSAAFSSVCELEQQARLTVNDDLAWLEYSTWSRRIRRLDMNSPLAPLNWWWRRCLASPALETVIVGGRYTFRRTGDQWRLEVFVSPIWHQELESQLQSLEAPPALRLLTEPGEEGLAVDLARRLGSTDITFDVRV